jgi:zinc transporter 1/2/3
MTAFKSFFYANTTT